MGIKFTNNAEGLLAAGIVPADVEIDLQSGNGALFPAITGGNGNYFYVTITDVSGNREVIKVIHRSTDTLGNDPTYPCVRAQDGTTAQSFSTGDKVQLRLPSVVLEEFESNISDNTTDIASNAADIAAIQADDSLIAPAGTELYFYQDSPPTGWTINTGPADSLLSVKGGSEAYNVTGGQVVSSWTPTAHIHDMGSHDHTGPVHSHTVDDHSHDIPDHKHEENQHSHSFSDSFTTSTENLPNGESGSGSNNLAKENHTHTGSVSGTTGYNNPDTYTGWTEDEVTEDDGPGATNTSGSGGNCSTEDIGNTDPSSAPASDRPKAAVGCIGTKD